jgi:DNA polymerase-3 subunit alpha
MLDGLATPKEYVKKAVENGQTSLALTDHGNLCGAAEFYKEARKADVEPIIGCEFYFAESFETSKEQKSAERSHVTVLGAGAEGYRVLSSLNADTWKQFYYKPILDRNLAEKLGDDTRHLVVLSGCAGSRLSRLLMADDEDGAREELIWWRDTFPNYFIELMHHDTEFDFKLNGKLIELARKYKIPMVITNDPHFAVPEDQFNHDVLLAIQTASDVNDPNRFRFDGEGYYLKSRAEMYRSFKQYGKDIWKEGSNNTLLISEMCHTRIEAWDTKAWQLPEFPDVDDSYKELKRLCVRGLKQRGLWGEPEYMTRVRHELKVIHKVGIEDFLLITRDTIEWCARGGMHPDLGPLRVGPGRGSVCGTLVGWLIGLHKMDPIKYNLMFERFLNPARPKMPDIDTDFSQRRRQEVFDYNINKYGEDNTMAVAAYSKMQMKAAFNSISKSYGIGYVEAQRLNKEIIEDEDEDGNHQYLLPDEVTKKYPEMTNTLNRLAGVKRSISAHPAGLIIASPDAKLRDQVPEMYIPSSKRWVAAYDKKTIESMGFMKQDFLGLRTIDTIDETVKLIKERQGIDVEPDSWVPDEEPDDDLVYKMLSEGRTAGVFQMEGPTNQRGCKDVRPRSFEDIVSITSLYRTGPIAAGYPKQFINNRKIGRRNIEYLHPMLKPILRSTWGVILYQEQVMEIGSSLAGFSMVQVDEIKEAIKDKSSDEMTRLKPMFIAGCKKVNRIPERTSTAIWKIIEGYAGYGYNRSHAVAYTFLTYQTARLKLKYPVEFASALLRTIPNTKDNAEKREVYMREAITLGCRIEPPDINLSHYGATPDATEDLIRLGLTDFSGIGGKQAEKLLKGRPEGGYTSVEQVTQAANNSGVMKTLTLGSALTSLGVPGDEEETEKLLKWTFVDKMKRYRDQHESSVILPSDELDGENVNLVGMIYKIDKGATKTGKRFVTWKLRWSITENYDIRLWSETEKYWDLREGSVVRVMGKWEKRWMNISCGNPRMIQVIRGVRIMETAE